MFALFKSILLRNTFLSNARWFCAKKHKNGEGNLYLPKDRLCINEIFCAEDNCSYMSNMCAKEYSDLNLHQAVIGKISIFKTIVPNFTFSHLSIIGIFKTNCFYLINFMEVAWGHTLFQFCQLWVVKNRVLPTQYLPPVSKFKHFMAKNLSIRV